MNARTSSMMASTMARMGSSKPTRNTLMTFRMVLAMFNIAIMNSNTESMVLMIAFGITMRGSRLG